MRRSAGVSAVLVGRRAPVADERSAEPVVLPPGVIEPRAVAPGAVAGLALLGDGEGGVVGGVGIGSDPEVEGAGLDGSLMGLRAPEAELVGVE